MKETLDDLVVRYQDPVRVGKICPITGRWCDSLVHKPRAHSLEPYDITGHFYCNYGPVPTLLVGFFKEPFASSCYGSDGKAEVILNGQYICPRDLR